MLGGVCVLAAIPVRTGACQFLGLEPHVTFVLGETRHAVGAIVTLI